MIYQIIICLHLKSTILNVTYLLIKVKSLIVYLTEIFAGKYLNKFELIDLYFDESL